MYQSVSVNLLNLLLSLSDALDLASPLLSQHQLRTAFIAWEIGKVAKLSENSLEQLFIAALLHDVGALSPEEKIDLHQAEVTNTEHHCVLGEAFIRRVPMFTSSAQVVQFHHRPWQAWEEPLNKPVVLQSQILALADTLERSIDRSKYILHQDKELVSLISSKERLISPEVIAMFRAIAVREDFWLDLVSPRLYSLLLHNGPCRGTEIDLSELRVISEMFRNLIDFRSRFTSTHSSGVAASAAAIARLFGLTEMEVDLMEVTGNLHDLGKLVVPNSILEKPDKLTPEEFAVMRQHTYFTYSVLSTIGGIQAIAEWAAFHHERLDGSGYPFHLDGKKLNTGSRILAIADILTALAEDRPYRKGMGQTEIISILRNLSEKNFIDRTVLGVLEENYEEIITQTMKKQTNVRKCYEQEVTGLK